MLPYLSIETDKNPNASIIWLHGLGADGHDFESIIPELNLSSSMKIRFIFPHAPIRPISINGGIPMRGWYDILYPDLSLSPDIEGIGESSKQISELIYDEKKKGISFERIILAGFSQGGVIALQTALRFSDRLGGLIALSTYSPTVERLKQEASRANQNLPLFWGHGVLDPVVPISLAEKTEKILSEIGYFVEFHRYAGMPHSVCQEEVSHIALFLQRILA